MQGVYSVKTIYSLSKNLTLKSFVLAKDLIKYYAKFHSHFLLEVSLTIVHDPNTPISQLSIYTNMQLC